MKNLIRIIFVSLFITGCSNIESVSGGLGYRKASASVTIHFRNKQVDFKETTLPVLYHQGQTINPNGRLN